MTSVATPVAAREPAPGHSIGNITSECLVHLININSILGHSLVGGERENLLRWARDMLVLGPPGSGLEYRLRLSPGLKQSYLDALHCILESLRSCELPNANTRSAFRHPLTMTAQPRRAKALLMLMALLSVAKP